MARRSRRLREQPGPSGFLVVDKPRGWTSHDVVAAARRWLGTHRVGHLGTLDPQATGVLPLALRAATKLISFMESATKAYAGAIQLGVETDTLDGDGEVVRRFEGELPDASAVERALAAFRGEILQTPPMYSAVKKAGVPLYRLARRGERVERAPRRVAIEELRLMSYEPPFVEIEVVCSPGTYVRSLAADVGEHLGCGAHLARLCRTRNGPFRLEEAATVEQLEADARAGKLDRRIIPPVEGLGLPVYPLAELEARRVAHGGELLAVRGRIAVEEPGARLAGVAPDGALVAILELRAERCLRPLRVLPQLATRV